MPNTGYVILCLIDFPYASSKPKSGSGNGLVHCMQPIPIYRNAVDTHPPASRSRSEPFLGLASQIIDRLLHPATLSERSHPISPARPFARPPVRPPSLGLGTATLGCLESGECCVVVRAGCTGVVYLCRCIIAKTKQLYIMKCI